MKRKSSRNFERRQRPKSHPARYDARATHAPSMSDIIAMLARRRERINAAGGTWETK